MSEQGKSKVILSYKQIQKLDDTQRKDSIYKESFLCVLATFGERQLHRFGAIG